MCAPITTVRSSGSLKYGTGFAAFRDIATKSRLRQRLIPPDRVGTTVVSEMKYDASSRSTSPRGRARI